MISVCSLKNGTWYFRNARFISVNSAFEIPLEMFTPRISVPSFGAKALLECVDNHLVHRPFYLTFNRETQPLVV